MKRYYITLLIIALTIFGFVSCNSNKNDERIKEDTIKNSVKSISEISKSEGYKLMEQKCFICHFVKPDPSKKGSMIAPPMLRVQQHYKPTYPNKEEFINKITEWIVNPSKQRTLMPGAVRKFDIMPKLGYSKKEIQLIAETLFEIDFGNIPKMGMRMHNNMDLNNGKKWKLNTNTIDLINSLSNKLEKFRSENISEYNILGKEIFDKAKVILLNKSYSENIFNQLHSFFNDIEKNIHLLISTNNLNEAKKQQLILVNKFSKFNYYFE